MVDRSGVAGVARATHAVAMGTRLPDTLATLRCSGLTDDMNSLWLYLGLPVVLIGYGLFAVVRRGFQMRQLVLDGVETRGVVTAKLEYAGGRGSRRSQRRIAYSYCDAAGVEHRHVSMVTSDFWNGHNEGGPIDLIYSRSQPQVSAPKHLVELSREALAKAGKI